MVAKVEAYIEFDVDELIHEVMETYNVSIADVTMDQITEYVSENISHLDNVFARGKWIASDGPSIDGFTPSTYKEIEDVLTRMQEEAA